MILTNSGVLKLMQRIKSFITAQLNTKAASVHTHSISEIDNLASQLGGGGYTKSESDDKFVDKTSNQTISGNKKFTNTVTIEKSGGDTELLVKNTAVDATSITTNAMDDIRFVDQNDNITGGLRLSYETNGSISTTMYARSYSQDGLTYANKVFTITSNLQTGISNSRLSTDFVPDTNNIYNLGSSSLQWNNAYVKSLTINGVACGDILTHNKSEFVDVVNSQTIDGTKTFLDSVFIKRSNPFLQIRSTGYVKGVAPSDNYYQGIRFYDDETSNSENHIVGGFETQYSTSGYNISNINCRNYDQNNVHLNYSAGLYVPNDNTRPIQFVPSVNNVINIGSPSYQWNNTYTRNILIDNDINIESSLINKTSTSGVISIRGGINTQDGASIDLYGKDYAGASNRAGNLYMTAYGNSDYTNLRISPNGIVSVYNNSTNTTKNIAMQEDVIPRSGGAVISPNTTIGAVNNTSSIRYCGGTDDTTGASIQLNGKDTAGNKGIAFIAGNNGTSINTLAIKPDGSATLDNGNTTKNLAMQEDVIPRSGGAVMTGYLLGRTIDTSNIMICGGSGGTGNAHIQIFGGLGENPLAGGLLLGSVSGGSSVSIIFEKANLFRPSTDGAIALGNGNYRWGQIYSTNSTISTSDSRLKNTISSIDDSLLDAWETIQPKQYKFNDATETKGDTARFHTGYLAQDIEKACNDNNIDATRYGLFCYDSWEEEPEITEDVEVEKDGVKTTEKRIVQQKREKGDMYALRYEETLVVECAYLRREVSKLKQQNENLEQRLKMLEQSVK